MTSFQQRQSFGMVTEVERVILLEYFFVAGPLPAGPVSVCGSWKEMQSNLLFRSCPYFHEVTKMNS